MKHSPGCGCCGEDCLDHCYFPCTGADNKFECQICGIDIQMPIPDTVGSLASLPAEGCPESAPCHECYHLFDKRINFWTGFFSFAFFGSCNDYSALATFPRSVSNNDITIILERGVIKGSPCWNPSDYACPYYDNSDNLCAGSEIVIGDPPIFPGAAFILEGNEWDGECGKITFKIRYTVLRFDVNYNTAPITDPNACNDPEYSVYEHLFELPYCTCDDLSNPMTYISTTVIQESCAGGVDDDPCNIDQAVITLVRSRVVDYGPYDSWECPDCLCANCDGYNPFELSVSISGPVFNATVILPLRGGGPNVGGIGVVEGYCSARGDIDTAAGGCTERLFFDVTINCLICDKFTANISLRINDPNSLGTIELFTGRTEAFDCGDTPTFTKTFSTGQCSIDSHTIQLSFVPA